MSSNQKLSVTLILATITFGAFVFVHNLPNWCANPNGAGNFLVQPLCK